MWVTLKNTWLSPLPQTASDLLDEKVSYEVARELLHVLVTYGKSATYASEVLVCQMQNYELLLVYRKLFEF